jgi:hypothetical protein
VQTTIRASGKTLTAKLVVVTRTVPTPGWRNDVTLIIGGATSCPAQVLAKAGLAASRASWWWQYQDNQALGTRITAEAGLRP